MVFLFPARLSLYANNWKASALDYSAFPVCTNGSAEEFVQGHNRGLHQHVYNAIKALELDIRKLVSRLLTFVEWLQ